MWCLKKMNPEIKYGLSPFSTNIMLGYDYPLDKPMLNSRNFSSLLVLGIIPHEWLVDQWHHTAVKIPNTIPDLGLMVANIFPHCWLHHKHIQRVKIASLCSKNGQSNRSQRIYLSFRVLHLNHLVGGFNPLKNISQMGLLFPIYGKIKNVWNHQPVMVQVL